MRKFRVKVGDEVYIVEAEEVQGERETTVKPGAVAPKTPSQPSGAPTLAGDGQEEGGVIVAPMPAKVLQIRCSVGQVVEQGETLLVLEAMKMEQEMRAPKSGRVTKIVVREGDGVGYGEILIVLE